MKCKRNLQLYIDLISLNYKMHSDAKLRREVLFGGTVKPDFHSHLLPVVSEIELGWDICKVNKLIESDGKNIFRSIQVILAGTLTGVQSDIQCKVLAALSTVK